MSETKTQKQEREEREKEIEDLRKVMNTPEGQRFLRRAVSRCRVFQSSFKGQSNNTIFHEGERNIGLWLIAEIEEATPSYLVNVLKGGKL